LVSDPPWEGPSQSYAALPRRMGKRWSPADGPATHPGSLREERATPFDAVDAPRLPPALMGRRLPAPARLANSCRPPPPGTASGTLPASDFEGLLSGPAGHVTAPARPSSRVRATFQTVSSLRTLTWLGASPMPCSPRRVHDMAWPPLRRQSLTEGTAARLLAPTTVTRDAISSDA
jgi:hypothetical protein